MQAPIIFGICRKTSFCLGGMYVKQTALLQGSLRVILEAMVTEM